MRFERESICTYIHTGFFGILRIHHIVIFSGAMSVYGLQLWALAIKAYNRHRSVLGHTWFFFHIVVLCQANHRAKSPNGGLIGQGAGT